MADGSADRARLRAIAAGIERDYPLRCRRTLLSLHDLDPDLLQAQWQLEPGHLALVRGGFPAGMGGIHQRLRLLRVDADNQEVASLALPPGRVDVQGVARFLVEGGPGVLYQAELGLASPDGGWLLLARSNVATVPPRPGELTPSVTWVGQARGGMAVMKATLPPPPTETVPAPGPDTPPEIAPATVLDILLPATREEPGSVPDRTLADSGAPLVPAFPPPRPPSASAGTGAGANARPSAGASAETGAGGAGIHLADPSPTSEIIPLIIARQVPPPGREQGGADKLPVRERNGWRVREHYGSSFGRAEGWPAGESQRSPVGETQGLALGTASGDGAGQPVRGANGFGRDPCSDLARGLDGSRSAGSPSSWVWSFPRLPLRRSPGNRP
jgi:hypothetical protein